jgi:hypothetical protein
MTSGHPEDERHGYCGNCHDWTGAEPRVFTDARGLVRQVVAYQLLIEAASSVTSSHRPDCVCVVCRAAGGDEDALIELLPLVPGWT